MHAPFQIDAGIAGAKALSLLSETGWNPLGLGGICSSDCNGFRFNEWSESEAERYVEEARETEPKTLVGGQGAIPLLTSADCKKEVRVPVTLTKVAGGSLLLGLLVALLACEPSVEFVPAESLLELKAQLEAAPNDCVVHEQLGAVLQQQHRYAESIDHYRKSLEFCPGDPFVWKSLGISTVLTSSCEEGFTLMGKAVAMAKAQGEGETAALLQLELEAWRSKKDELPAGCR